MTAKLNEYSPGQYYDELVAADGTGHSHAQGLVRYFAAMDRDELVNRQHAVNRTIADMGISFTIYSEGDNIDRAWPLDLVPRVMPATEWDHVEAGLVQRLTALNLFIDDLYNARRILKDGVVPAELIDSSRNYLGPCRGVSPRHRVWAHVCGTDLVRGSDGTIYVLEDNLRVPSGVSYMLENRETMLHMFPELFSKIKVRPVQDYPKRLRRSLAACQPDMCDRKPVIVFLTPGIHNSAYYE
ncbi:MAG: circularly permuted type 2 ATP-grasp protein, partial [Pseudomonadota bacterium]